MQIGEDLIAPFPPAAGGEARALGLITDAPQPLSCGLRQISQCAVLAGYFGEAVRRHRVAELRRRVVDCVNRFPCHFWLLLLLRPAADAYAFAGSGSLIVNRHLPCAPFLVVRSSLGAAAFLA